MSIKIGICDDSMKDAKILTDAVYKYNPTFQIFNYTNGESLLDDLKEQKVLFDILFLDIYMPGLSGIETASIIRESTKDAKIIFISSSNEHYPEAFGVFAFNYLIKPLNVEKLNIILDQAMRDITREWRQQISFSYKSKTYRVVCNDILYIESIDKTICFHMANKTVLQCYSKLDDILRQLPEDTFIRCHQSFAINVYHVTEMDENHFCINSITLNISKKYRKSAKDKYVAYLFDHMNKDF